MDVLGCEKRVDGAEMWLCLSKLRSVLNRAKKRHRFPALPAHFIDGDFASVDVSDATAVYLSSLYFPTEVQGPQKAFRKPARSGSFPALVSNANLGDY